MSANIMMTLPKFVPIPNKRGIPLPSPNPIDELLVCGKKRRLDHLTWEEKLQRKKLKNRVAAQTSRDRKKAKMDEMEQTIKHLSEENETLKARFQRLTNDNEMLLKRNIELERDLNQLRSSIANGNLNGQSIKVETIDSTNVCEHERWMGSGIKNGSAVSTLINPLPKELKPQSIRCHESTLKSFVPTQQTLTPPSTPPPAHQSIPFESNKRAKSNQQQYHQNQNQQKQQQQLHQPQIPEDAPMNLRKNTDSAALWKIIALCLLYRTCSKISTQAGWKNWPKVYSPMSQQTLKMMLLKAATELPKLKANQSQCLDQWWGPKQKSWNPAKIPMEA